MISNQGGGPTIQQKLACGIHKTLIFKRDPVHIEIGHSLPSGSSQKRAGK